MKSTQSSPHIDLFARVVCLIGGVLFAMGAGLAYSPSNFSGLFMFLSAVAAVHLVAGIAGPRKLRTAIVSWLPWF